MDEGEKEKRRRRMTSDADEIEAINGLALIRRNQRSRKVVVVILRNGKVA